MYRIIIPVLIGPIQLHVLVGPPLRLVHRHLRPFPDAHRLGGELLRLELGIPIHDTSY